MPTKLPIKIYEYTRLTPTLRRRVAHHITTWNNNRWDPEEFLDFPQGHWVLLEARAGQLSVGYFLLAFDYPGARITLPIEKVFSKQPEIFPQFNGVNRGEAVFTIVDPSVRGKRIFQQLVTRVFWHILSKKIDVILSETEEPTIKLYRAIGLRIRKLSDITVDYQGGPCFPCEIPFSAWYKLEGIISCLRYGTLREISFFGRE